MLVKGLGGGWLLLACEAPEVQYAAWLLALRNQILDQSVVIRRLLWIDRVRTVIQSVILLPSVDGDHLAPPLLRIIRGPVGVDAGKPQPPERVEQESGVRILILRTAH